MSKKPCASCESNRLTLLAQAERILVNKFKVNHERIYYLIERRLLDPMKVDWPDPPGSEEIMAEAERLYAFIKEN